MRRLFGRRAAFVPSTKAARRGCVALAPSTKATQRSDVSSSVAGTARAEENEFGGVTALFISLFEPAMILLMGLVVLFIVVAILIPIFDMNELV